MSAFGTHGSESECFNERATAESALQPSVRLTPANPVAIFLSPRHSWGRSSVGRALEWHSRGQGFDPPRLHQSTSTHQLSQGRGGACPFPGALKGLPYIRGKGNRSARPITKLERSRSAPPIDGSDGAGSRLRGGFPDEVRACKIPIMESVLYLSSDSPVCSTFGLRGRPGFQ